MNDSSLARSQAALVAALVGTGPDPVGFDQHRLQVARAALLRKRADGVAARWPYLVAGLGREWPATFSGWADGRPTVGSLLDGWDLAEHLEGAGRLGPLARTELALYRADFERTGSGLRHRHGLRQARSGSTRVWRWGRRVIVRGRD